CRSLFVGVLPPRIVPFQPPLLLLVSGRDSRWVDECERVNNLKTILLHVFPVVDANVSKSKYFYMTLI
ncbi:unnamed protein product, partial [Musa hybrid cultivar]